MRKTVIILSVLTLIVGSCRQAMKKQVEIVQDEIIIGENSEEQDSEFIDYFVNYQYIDGAVTINFLDFILTINRLSLWDGRKYIDEIHKDTVYLDVELGENIEGQLLLIETSELIDIKVAQRYETSITIMNEGPHCDLTDWKHYYSEWQQLKKNEEGEFVCEKYERTEYEKFPAIDIEELKEEVKIRCGEKWFELVKNITSPTEYPSGVGISRYFLKITGVREKDNQLVEKLIILGNSMGC